MVFRKKSRRTRRYGFMKARSRSRHSSSSNPMGIIIPAMAYGAGRSYLSNLATPITSKIPLGSYADEVTFGVLGYFIAKKNLFGMKKLGEAMLTIEAASVGSQLINQVGTGSTDNNDANW